MQLLSTHGLPVAGRAAAWSKLYASQMSLCEFTPQNDGPFDAELLIGQLGPVKVARLTVDSCSVERKQSHIKRTSPRLYNFLLQAEGSSRFHHCGIESQLEAGDFVLCDTGLPHYFSTEGHSVTVMVRVPSGVLGAYLPTPERYCGRQLGSASGLSGAVAAMVRELGAAMGRGIAPECEDRVARYLLELISMSYINGVETSGNASAVAWRRRKEVIQYIEANLRDPELSPASIAEGLGVSPRYLRTVFAPGREKMSAYILRRRLEECARQMCTPAWSAHTLTEIAFSWGFNSAAHFTRTFHEKFGETPRDYRRKGIAAATMSAAA